MAWVLLLHLSLLLPSSVVVDLLLRRSELGWRVSLDWGTRDSCRSSDDLERLWKRRQRRRATRSQLE